MDALSINANSNTVVTRASNPNTNTSVNRAQAGSGSNNTEKTAAQEAIQRQRDDSAENAREKQQQISRQNLENVVSRSEDGDTVQVKPETKELTMGTVTMRESEPSQAQKFLEERRKKEAEDDSRATEITSFAGYTSSQIERLYQQGRISRQDYEREMANRRDRNEATASNNAQTEREMARLNGTLSRAQMDASAIDAAYGSGSNANSPASASERIDAMQRMQDYNQTQDSLRVNEGRRQWDYQLQA